MKDFFPQLTSGLLFQLVITDSGFTSLKMCQSAWTLYLFMISGQVPAPTFEKQILVKCLNQDGISEYGRLLTPPKRSNKQSLGFFPSQWHIVSLSSDRMLLSMLVFCVKQGAAGPNDINVHSSKDGWGSLEISFFTICDFHHWCVSFLWQSWIATERCCRNVKRNFSNFKPASGQQSQEFSPLILLVSGQWWNKSEPGPVVGLHPLPPPSKKWDFNNFELLCHQHTLEKRWMFKLYLNLFI